MLANYRFFLLIFPCLMWPSLNMAIAEEFDYGGEEELKQDIIIPFKHPKRKVSVIVTDSGYYPEKIIAYKGEKITFYVTSTVPEPSCLILSGHELFLSAEKGKLVVGEVELKSSGDFSFYCPSQNYKGSLVVIEKEKRKKPKRNLASKKSKIWMPKEK